MLKSDIIKILSYIEDDEEILINENRYCGGGDEYYETDFSIVEYPNGSISFVPAPDTDIISDGVKLNPVDF